jgi:protocatechuate 3,4-dioxygenase beta subunit
MGEGRLMGQEDFIQRDLAQHPLTISPLYKTSMFRGPTRPPLSLKTGMADLAGPVFGAEELGPRDNDLILNYAKEGFPVGERIIIHGRVLDGNARPLRGVLVELWQANASGKYRHRNDGYIGAIDPNFGGCGRCLTDGDGRYIFRTIKPGPYPFRNKVNDWRPAHIHFSVFGTGFAQRLITQMYFEGDPLIRHDSILNTIPDAVARDRLVARLDLAASVPLDTLAYRWDIVLRGTRASVFEN